MAISGDKKMTWRDDPGLSTTASYKKCFALLPKTSDDGQKMWLVNYYKKYLTWGSGRGVTWDDSEGHTELVELITEAEYLVRKLAEKL